MRQIKRPKIQNLQSKTVFLAVVGLVTMAGVLSLVLSHAATSGSAIEAEQAIVSGAVGVISDSGASGGQALQFGVAASAMPAGSNPFGSVGTRSGMSFNDGIWSLDRTGSAASYTSALKYAETARGRLSDLNMSAQYNAKWTDLTGVQILQFLNDYNAPVSILMLPPWPEGQGDWGSAANGSYDSYYKQLGANIASIRPNAKTVLRLGWEFNGSWYDWSVIKAPGGSAAARATNFINGWHHIADNVRAGAGGQAKNILFDFSTSSTDDYNGNGNVYNLYPGDSYVDVIGMDIYDSGKVTTSDTTPGFNAEMTTGYNFAVQHGKMLSFDEWGMHDTHNGNDGGDNPHFINAMFTWFRAHKSNLAWEQYFQDDALDNVHNSLFSPGLGNYNPNGRAAYLNQLKTP
jgi:hypothetical protein